MVPTGVHLVSCTMLSISGLSIYGADVVFPPIDMAVAILYLQYGKFGGIIGYIGLIKSIYEY